eukprot:TRINITY_DN21499_c0_g1_i1.p1 TRINITY_DN21499_c0_g1~~TRINITY_DN21499_c0_g1_i1.p1  ORF type:complete len:1684 (-),score=480.31 TRINITY_DN21499_c0_g1_i1:299-5350(-)
MRAGGTRLQGLGRGGGGAVGQPGKLVSPRDNAVGGGRLGGTAYARAVTPDAGTGGRSPGWGTPRSGFGTPRSRGAFNFEDVDGGTGGLRIASRSPSPALGEVGSAGTQALVRKLMRAPGVPLAKKLDMSQAELNRELSLLVARLDAAVFNWSETLPAEQRGRLTSLLLQLTEPFAPFRNELREATSLLETALTDLQDTQYRGFGSGDPAKILRIAGVSEVSTQTRLDRGDKIYADKAVGEGEVMTYKPAGFDQAPDILQITVPRGGDSGKISGLYELVQGVKPAGMPLWKHRRQNYWLFTGTSGQWFIGDVDEMQANFKCDTGVVASMHKHGGVHPHKIGFGGWQWYDEDRGGVWMPEQSIGIVAVQSDILDGGRAVPASTGFQGLSPMEAKKLREAWGEVDAARAEAARLDREIRGKVDSLTRENEQLKWRLIDTETSRGGRSQGLVLGDAMPGSPVSISSSTHTALDVERGDVGLRRQAPFELSIVGSRVVEANGRYELVKGKMVNGMPLWKATDADRWIYSGAGEVNVWVVGDETEEMQDFNCSTGLLASSAAHGGAMPHRIPLGQWHYFDQSGGDWLKDPDVRLQGETYATGVHAMALEREIEKSRQTVESLRREEQQLRQLIGRNRHKLRNMAPSSKGDAKAEVDSGMKVRLARAEQELKRLRQDRDEALQRAVRAENVMLGQVEALEKKSSSSPRKDGFSPRLSPDVLAKRAEEPWKRVHLRVSDHARELFAGEYELRMVGPTTGRAVYRSAFGDKNTFLAKADDGTWLIKKQAIGGETLAVAKDDEVVPLAATKGVEDARMDLAVGTLYEDMRRGHGRTTPLIGQLVGSQEEAQTELQKAAEAHAAKVQGLADANVLLRKQLRAAQQDAATSAEQGAEGIPSRQELEAELGKLRRVNEENAVLRRNLEAAKRNAEAPEAPLMPVAPSKAQVAIAANSSEPPPPTIFVESPNWETRCAGRYALYATPSGIRQGLPVWRHEARPELQLYSDDGLWIIGDGVGREFVASAAPHRSKLPHRIRDGGWNVFNGKNFIADAAVTVVAESASAVLTAAAQAGATTLHVSTLQGFQVGDRILVGGETNTIQRFGDPTKAFDSSPAIVLGGALRSKHAQGCVVRRKDKSQALQQQATASKAEPPSRQGSPERAEDKLQVSKLGSPTRLQEKTAQGGPKTSSPQGSSGKFLLSAEEASQDLSRTIYVASDQGGHGVYKLLPRKANAKPVWKHIDHEEYVFCGSAGNWFIGDESQAADNFSNDEGFVTSKKAPHSLPYNLLEGSWLALNSSDEWRPARNIKMYSQASYEEAGRPALFLDEHIAAFREKIRDDIAKLSPSIGQQHRNRLNLAWEALDVDGDLMVEMHEALDYFSTCKILSTEIRQAVLAEKAGETVPEAEQGRLELEASADIKELGWTLQGTPPKVVYVKSLVDGGWAAKQYVEEWHSIYSVNDVLVADMTKKDFAAASKARPFRCVVCKVYLTLAGLMELLQRWMDANPKSVKKVELELDQAIASSASKKVVQDKRNRLKDEDRRHKAASFGRASGRRSLRTMPLQGKQQEAARSDYPPVLQINSPQWEKQCAGAYKLVASQTKENLPVWRHIKRTQYLLYSDDGHWVVGDGMDQEHISSVEPHEHKLPHRVPKGGWNVYNGRDFVIDKNVAAVPVGWKEEQGQNKGTMASARDLIN